MEINEKKLASLSLAVAATSLVISICSGIYVITHKTVYVSIDSLFGKITGNLPAEERPIDLLSNKEPNESNKPDIMERLRAMREARREAEANVAAEELKEKEATEIRRRKYVESHPDISDYIKKAILDGHFAYGMTKEQCIVSVGEPDNINKGEIYEQFIYGSTTIYFENGIAVEH